MGRKGEGKEVRWDGREGLEKGTIDPGGGGRGVQSVVSGPLPLVQLYAHIFTITNQIRDVVNKLPFL